MRSRVVPGRSSTIATRSPTMRLKSVDFPTLGLPTTATTARDTRLGRDRCGELLGALLDLEERVHRCRATTDEPYAFLIPQPLRPQLIGVLDVIRGATLHLREVHELPRVRGVLPADDDDRWDLLGELAGRDLSLDRHGTDGVVDLHLLRDLGDVRHELAERPGRLGRLRDHTSALHLRQL